MSGEILTEKQSIRTVFLSLLLSIIPSFVLMMIALRGLSISGTSAAVSAAILAYVLFRILYPTVAQFLSIRQLIHWELTKDTLILDGRKIALETIRAVHCWSNRDALGHSFSGWTVNIETSGKNVVLRSLTQGDDVEASAQALQKLVNALGYPWAEM